MMTICENESDSSDSGIDSRGYPLIVLLPGFRKSAFYETVNQYINSPKYYR